MSRWLIMLSVALIFIVPASAQALDISSDENVDLQAAGGRLFQATSRENAVQAPPPGGVDSFLGKKIPAGDISRISGGGYWFHISLTNQTATTEWVLDIHDTVADTFRAYLYHNNSVTEVESGLLSPGRYGLYYGMNLDIAQGETVELLVYMESRAFSGTPRFELTTESRYLKKLAAHYSILLACFGAMIVLAIYNGLVGVWIRDRAYLYYSAYLVTTIVAWAGTFNIISVLFGMSSAYALPAPFFLLMGFSSLYVIHFLDLKTSYPRLAKITYGFAAICLVMTALPNLPDAGTYMALHCLASLVWVSLALCAGLLRLRDGFKPARFFVLAFSVVSVGSAPSVFATLGLIEAVQHHYLITIVSQTIDMALLALALADRINTLRIQREDALHRAIDVEHHATEKERDASLTLQQALDISEKESEKKSEFLRMVSHELRTPLHSILAATEQWDDHAEEIDKNDLIGYVTYGIARLRTQIDNLVLFAETEADDIKPDSQPFEMRTLIDRLINKTKPTLADAVHFELHYSNDIPKICEGDNYLLEHMLRTVLDNAFKYTVHGVIRLDLDWDSEQSKLLVHLKDTGCGMSQHQLQDVFNNFVQVSRGLNRSSEGLGLGLTICYRVCEILGADFQVESEPGVGTEIQVEVGLKAMSSHLSLVGSRKPITADEICRVLLVEDNDVNAAVITRVVTQMGYTVDRASSGQDGVQRAIGEEYHLILMDIQMPIMDGITAARWIRRRGINVPIVAVSANSDMKVRKRCGEVGINDFLVKPIAQADIQRVLTRLLPPVAGGKTE